MSPQNLENIKLKDAFSFHKVIGCKFQILIGCLHEICPVQEIKTWTAEKGLVSSNMTSYENIISQTYIGNKNH